MPYKALSPHSDKSHIQKILFTEQEVLSTHTARTKRQAKLLSAATMDAAKNTEVIITFEDQKSCTRLQTGIFALTDAKVLLNCGRSIPLNCIHHVQLVKQ